MKLKIIAFDQKGAAAVEFAIILPLLIMLLFGIIEFGILLYDKAMITNASREGARAGIVFVSDDPDDSDEIIYAKFKKNIDDAVNKYCSGHLITFGEDSTIHDIDIIPKVTKPTSGENLTVTVTYRYDYLVLPNFITGIVGNMNLAAQTIMRME